MASGFCLYQRTTTGGGPLLIKIGASASIAGFATEQLARTFQDSFQLGEQFHVVRLSALGSEIAPWFATGLRSNTVLLFDAAETLDKYAKDREHFPYSSYVVELKEAS